MKKITKIIALIVAVILIAVVLFFANALVGNPISYMLASGDVEEYVDNTYPNTDYYVDSVNFDFKNTGYYAHVKSVSSEDTYFSVSYNMYGKVVRDNYQSSVADGFNTWNRINSEYNDKMDVAISKLSFKNDISYGDLQTLDKYSEGADYGLDMTTLELDKQYDLKELGKEYGKAIMYAYTDEVSVEKAGEVLLEIKEKYDAENVAFNTINLSLQTTANYELKNWQDKDTIRLDNFAYSDIGASDMLAKIQICKDKTEAYNEEQDAIRQKEEMEMSEE